MRERGRVGRRKGGCSAVVGGLRWWCGGGAILGGCEWWYVCCFCRGSGCCFCSGGFGCVWVEAEGGFEMIGW